MSNFCCRQLICNELWWVDLNKEEREKEGRRRFLELPIDCPRKKFTKAQRKAFRKSKKESKIFLGATQKQRTTALIKSSLEGNVTCMQ